MTVRDVGDQADLEHRVYNADGILTNATVVLTVTSPSGTTSTPSVSNISVGVYRASFALSAAGVWSWVWSVSGAVVDIDTGQVTATSPAPQPYATLTQLRQAVGAESGDTTRNELLTLALIGASRSVEKFCDGREPGAFWLATAATARVYNVGRWIRCDSWGEWVRVDDIGSTNGLVVEVSGNDGLSYTTVTDVETRPDNALVRGRAINTLFSPSRAFGGHRLLRVTARWGWPEVPDEIQQATLLQASRLFRRKDSPEGVAGSADWGLVRVPNIDPDVKALLSDYQSVMVA